MSLVGCSTRVTVFWVDAQRFIHGGPIEVTIFSGTSAGARDACRDIAHSFCESLFAAEGARGAVAGMTNAGFVIDEEGSLLAVSSAIFHLIQELHPSVVRATFRLDDSTVELP